jgi:uncharacterized cupredoxin-like copper-binding protein
MFKSSRLLAALAAVLLWTFALPALAAGAQVVNAELRTKPDGSQVIMLSTAEVKPGRVTFNVTNMAPDMEHQLLLVKTDLAPADFPMDASGRSVDEKKFKGIKDLGDLHPGSRHSTTIKLTAGKYILFCNYPGHFKAGMVIPFTVAP